MFASVNEGGLRVWAGGEVVVSTEGELIALIGGLGTFAGFKAITKPVIAVITPAAAVNIPGIVCHQDWWVCGSSDISHSPYFPLPDPASAETF
jgi:hypothetical protein